MDNREEIKQYVHNLYDSLMQRSDKTAHLLNITDVLAQVYLKVDRVKNPEALVSKLVNYIYMEGFSRVSLSKAEEHWLIELGNISKRAGWNGRYRANVDDKSEFYSIFERMPIR